MNSQERSFLIKTIRSVPRYGAVAEVGSWTGGSALTMLGASSRNHKMLYFYFIDPWRYGEGECAPELSQNAREIKQKFGKTIKEIFQKRVFAYKGKYKMIELDSEKASKRFLPETLDMVFLDGDHSYKGVKKDIECWYPKLKMGGILCGHDYGRKEYGVTEAVNYYFSDVENTARSMWKTIKKEKELEHIPSETEGIHE